MVTDEDEAEERVENKVSGCDTVMQSGDIEDHALTIRDGRST